jgi:hypothetical protein
MLQPDVSIFKWMAILNGFLEGLSHLKQGLIVTKRGLVDKHTYYFLKYWQTDLMDKPYS